MTSGRCVPPDVGSSQLTTVCVPEPGDLFLRMWDRCPPSAGMALKSARLSRDCPAVLGSQPPSHSK